MTCHIQKGPIDIFSMKLIRQVSSHSKASSTTATTATTAWADGSDSSEFEPKPSVGFAPIARARLIISRVEFTAEDRRSLWYQKDEYRKISKECCKQIEKMENGGVLKDKRYCSRGLEPYTKRGVMNKKEERKNSIDAVLCEQKRQRRQGILDEEAIANRYKSKTADYQLRALIFGSRDLREAKTLSW